MAQEAWRGRELGASHFKVICCIAYAHTPDVKRRKFGDKSIKYIFVGYDVWSKTYKLYDPINKKIIISRDVHFDEEAAWIWHNQGEPINILPLIE